MSHLDNIGVKIGQILPTIIDLLSLDTDNQLIGVFKTFVFSRTCKWLRYDVLIVH